MSDHNVDREKLRDIQAIFERAVTNNTIEDLKPYTDPEFSFVSFTDRSFSDFDSFSKQWRLTRIAMLGSGKFSTKLNPEPSLFIGDIAVCYGNSTNNMVDSSGNEYDFTSHWTVIFKRYNDEWKILRAHNSLNPFSNPMLKHAVKRKMIFISAASLLVGAGLCYFLTSLI